MYLYIYKVCLNRDKEPRKSRDGVVLEGFCPDPGGGGGDRRPKDRATDRVPSGSK